jgi:hypothetical protein
MLRNYFLIAIRNLKKNKIFSFINILGLALGMACSLLILLWVQDIHCCGIDCNINCIGNGKFPGNQSGIGKPGEEFEK